MTEETYRAIRAEYERLYEYDNASLHTLLIETQKKYFAGCRLDATRYIGYVADMQGYSDTITAINTIYRDRAEGEGA